MFFENDYDRAYAIERIACHEAGHSIVAWYSPTVSSVDIVSLGSFGKITAPFTLRRHALRLEQSYWESIAVSLGGLAGEKVGLQQLCTVGVEGDFGNAIKTSLLLKSNFPEYSCPFNVKSESENTLFFLENDGFRDFESERILNKSYFWAVYVITKYQRSFMSMVGELVCRKHLYQNDLFRILGSRPYALCDNPPL